MKPGSLVEYIGTTTFSNLAAKFKPYVKWLPARDRVYTIRSFIKCHVNDTTCVLLEEGNSGIHPLGGEFAFAIECYRELVIPPSIAKEISEILESELVLK